MENNQLEKQILGAVGGEENIEMVTHCMTRLRFILKDKSLFETEVIKTIKGVKGSSLSGDQHQIIIGQDVEKVYKSILNLLKNKENQNQTTKEKITIKNFFRIFVKTLSDIFIPIIPVLVASGFIMGFVGVSIYPGYFFPDKSLVQAYPQFGGIPLILNMFANSVFMFLPVIIGFSATKRFGGNPYVGALMGLIMVNPDLITPNSAGLVEVPAWNVFGYHVKQVGYQSTVLPALVTSFLIAKIDNWLKEKLPKLFRILSAGITLIFVGTLTFLLIGPILRSAGFAFSDGIIWLYNTTGIFGAAIFGLTFGLAIMTGMHHAFIPIQVQLIANMATTGGDFILPIGAMHNVAMGGAALGIWFLTKEKDLKTEASIAGITSILGISEPAIFGINLKFTFPFVAASIAASIGAMFMTIFKIRARGMGAGGVMGYLLYNPKDLVIYTIGMAISILIAFTLTVLYSKIVYKKEIKI